MIVHLAPKGVVTFCWAHFEKEELDKSFADADHVFWLVFSFAI